MQYFYGLLAVGAILLGMYVLLIAPGIGQQIAGLILILIGAVFLVAAELADIGASLRRQAPKPPTPPQEI